MPIAGFVIGVEPQAAQAAFKAISQIQGVEIYGSNDEDIIAVIETTTSKEMEQLQKTMEQQPGVLSVTLTYLNVEDEIFNED